VLYASKWDTERQRWNVPQDEQPTPGKAYALFGHVRSVKQDEDTHLVTLQIEWKDRMAAAAWANDLVERLNAEMRQRAIAHADASVGYLERELNTTSAVATREAINRLIEAQIKQRMLANVTREYAFRVVDRAVPADSDDPVRPRKFLLLVGGALFGFVLGVLAVSVRFALRQWRLASSPG